MNPRKTNPPSRPPGRPSDPRAPANDASAHAGYRLTAYLSGAISEAGRREVERHLSACEECRRELASMEDALAAAREALAPDPGARDPALSPERFEAILAAAGGSRWDQVARWASRHQRPLGLAAAALLVLGIIVVGSVPTRLGVVNRSRVAFYESSREPEAPAESAPGSDEYGGAYLANGTGAPARELKEKRLGSFAFGRKPAGAERAAGGGAAPRDAARPPAGAPASAETGLLALEDRAAPSSVEPPEPKKPPAYDPTVLRSVRRKPKPAADLPFAPAMRLSEEEKHRLETASLDELAPSTAVPEARPETPPALGLAVRDTKPDRNLNGVPDLVADTSAVEWGLRARKYGARWNEKGSKAGTGGRIEREEAKDGDATKSFLDAPLGGELPLRGEEKEGAAEAPGASVLYGFSEVPNGRSLDKASDDAFVSGTLLGEALKVPEPRLGDLERRLRAFAHYRALDPSLSFETFAARELRVPPPAAGDEGLGAEEFRRRYGVHPFVETRLDRFSTFGMDVDTASWSLAAAHLRAGKLPPPKAIRVEEFVNSFGEDIPVDPEEVFAFAAEGGPSPFGEGLDLLKIAVKARDLREGERKGAVLTFLIDSSGSMAAALSSGLEEEPSGGVSRKAVEGTSRIEAVQGALAALVGSLSSEDRVQIVAYATTPYLVLPLTPAREAERIVGAVRSIQPSGATNLEAGLDLAYRVADEAFDPRAVNRVILASDGAANLGSRNPEEILKRVEVFARRGIYLSALGFGLGKYDDAMLETLADRGNGNYAHVDTPERAQEILRENLPRTLHVLAADAKIQVEFNPDVVTHYRLLGYENRDIRDEDFRNDKVDAGEVGPGSTVTVLYEIRRRPAAAGNLGRIFLRYRDAGTGRVEERDYPLSPGVLATRLEETTDRFRFVASVAELAELLRGSYWARDGSYAKVIEVLGGLSPEFRATPEWREVAGAALRAQALTVRDLTSF